MDDDESPTPADVLNGQCEMCANYEVSLQTMQTEQETLREQFAAAKELYEKYGKELSEERLYRKEMEARFAALNEEAEQKMQICLGNVSSFEERLELLTKKQEADLADMDSELEAAKQRQTTLQTDLKTLYEKYQRLLHKNAQMADELREQDIELPQTVDELTMLALQLREDLIGEKAAREHECQELRDELAVGREQMLEMDMRAKDYEEQLVAYAHHAQQQQHQLEQYSNSGGRDQQQQRRRHQQQRKLSLSTGGSGTADGDGEDDEGERGGFAGTSASAVGDTNAAVTAQQRQHPPPYNSNSPSPQLLEHAAVDLLAPDVQQQQQQVADCCANPKCQHQKVAVELDRRLRRSMHERAQLQNMVLEQRNKCAQMQNELDTSETVQKDFVRLSQNLQVELEKIRQSECEVRWQEAEDVDRCNGCGAQLHAGPDARINCRHCGKVFCSNCTSHTMPSGPSKRPVPVCSLCHTLLSNKDHSLVDFLNQKQPYQSNEKNKK